MENCMECTLNRKFVMKYKCELHFIPTYFKNHATNIEISVQKAFHRRKCIRYETLLRLFVCGLIIQIFEELTII